MKKLKEIFGLVLMSGKKEKEMLDRESGLDQRERDFLEQDKELKAKVKQQKK